MAVKKENIILTLAALSIMAICPVSASLLSKPEGCHFIRSDEINDKSLSDLLLRVKELEHARSAFILNEESLVCGLISSDIAEIDSERNTALDKISKVCGERDSNHNVNREIVLSRLQEAKLALKRSELKLHAFENADINKARLNNANLSHAVSYWNRINDCINRR